MLVCVVFPSCDDSLLQAKSGVEVESTELALAFPMKPQEQKTFSQVSEQIMSETRFDKNI